MSTTLIEYWFRHICPLRSTFDSEINNNRSLARDSWATSEAVFYTMQVMSAACLTDTMPRLRESLPSLREQATLAITRRISEVRTLRTAPVTADLIFAVLAMGTSSHWILPGNSDDPWLESARELLSIWSVGISAADTLLHAYFRQALAYWEMLLTIVGRGSNSLTLETRRQKYHGRLRQAMFLEPDYAMMDEYQSIHSGLKPLGTLPNSWCGISNEVIEVFGQVLALCRSACEYDQDKSSLDLDTTSKALCDIAVAHELAKELLNMDFDTVVLLEEVQGFYVETRDDNTPVSHLLQTAEAYRKAGLLLLYMAFDDLIVNNNHGSTTAGVVPSDETDKEARARSLVDLTLQLVATLEKIPAESGSKFIHPMLYLSAAAGLRFDRWPGRYHGSGLPENVNRGTSRADSTLPNSTELRSHSDTLDVFLSPSVLKVAEARRLVWSRLGMIRPAGPHKTSDSLLRLVRGIWSEYDKAESNTPAMFWLKNLSQTGLEMLL